jgi:WD40 repeat protein
VDFSPDNKILAYATSGSKIYLWNIEQRLLLGSIGAHKGGVWSIAFSPNGKCLASGSTDGTLLITPTAVPTFKQYDWMPFGSYWSSCVETGK